uniref:Uncharacterized protein n=1 Tax=Lepeophtheirus salmonis TaxID=72036 RepID=A0A0K2TKX8_LEPSM
MCELKIEDNLQGTTPKTYCVNTTDLNLRRAFKVEAITKKVQVYSWRCNMKPIPTNWEGVMDKKLDALANLSDNGS